MNNKENNIEFQISDWDYHEINDDEDEQYIIKLFSKTDDDKEVCLKVTNFIPYLCIPCTKQI